MTLRMRRSTCWRVWSPRRRRRTGTRRRPRRGPARPSGSPPRRSTSVTTEVLRYAAFTIDGEGGNPAGVVLDARGLDAPQMQQIAADVGYSETAFLVARENEPNVYDVRYFSPMQEVPFCGHATIASAVALVERSPADELIFHIPAGFVSINTRRT